MVISVSGSVESQINLLRRFLPNVALWQVLWLPLVAVVPHCSPELLQALITALIMYLTVWLARFVSFQLVY